MVATVGEQVSRVSEHERSCLRTRSLGKRLLGPARVSERETHKCRRGAQMPPRKRHPRMSVGVKEGARKAGRV
jgi:hypothetical protein